MSLMANESKNEWPFVSLNRDLDHETRAGRRSERKLTLLESSDCNLAERKDNLDSQDWPVKVTYSQKQNKFARHNYLSAPGHEPLRLRC